jgi:catechol 2,3-dioxygenase-like lactoylglutathione lyase family enzyme
MELIVQWTFLPHDDPDDALAFYRDALGFEVRADVGSGARRRARLGG